MTAAEVGHLDAGVFAEPQKGGMMGRSVLCIGVALALSACASIVDGGKTESISIASIPGGASVTIKNLKTSEIVHQGTAPFTVQLNRSQGYFGRASYNLLFTSPGYQDAQVAVESKMNGWYIGNIVFGGLIGFLIVDPLTGAMWTLDPKSITQNLTEQTKQGAASGDLSLRVVLYEDIPADQRSNLVKVN